MRRVRSRFRDARVRSAKEDGNRSVDEYADARRSDNTHSCSARFILPEIRIAECNMYVKRCRIDCTTPYVYSYLYNIMNR